MRILGDGKITWENASASSKYLLEMRVAGDSYPRFRIRADGQIEWGGGSGALDAFLARQAANKLKVPSELFIDDNVLTLIRANAGDWALSARVSGDSSPRLILYTSGTLSWGSGSTGVDCDLRRRAANILNTPDRLEVGTLGVGNSAAGSTLGNVVKKIEVFDDAGNSLGFLAVYDSIT